MSLTTNRTGGQMALVVNKTTLHEADHELSYWLTRSPAERIAAVEVMRRRMYGAADAPGSRLQRVCRIVQRS